MALNIDAKFEGKLTFAFKNDKRNLGNFHQSTWKYQNSDFDGILLNPKKKMYELKIYRRAICHDNETRCKTGRGNDLFQNWDETLMNFNPSTRKSQKFAL